MENKIWDELSEESHGDLKKLYRVSKKYCDLKTMIVMERLFGSTNFKDEKDNDIELTNQEFTDTFLRSTPIEQCQLIAKEMRRNSDHDRHAIIYALELCGSISELVAKFKYKEFTEAIKLNERPLEGWINARDIFNVLFQLVCIANELGLSLEEIARSEVNSLASKDIADKNINKKANDVDDKVKND